MKNKLNQPSGSARHRALARINRRIRRDNVTGLLDNLDFVRARIEQKKAELLTLETTELELEESIKQNVKGEPRRWELPI